MTSSRRLGRNGRPWTPVRVWTAPFSCVDLAAKAVHAHFGMTRCATARAGQQGYTVPVAPRNPHTPPCVPLPHARPKSLPIGRCKASRTASFSSRAAAPRDPCARSSMMRCACLHDDDGTQKCLLMCHKPSINPSLITPACLPLQAKLPAQAQAAGAAATPSVAPAAASSPVTVDFGSGDAQQQPPAAVAASTPAPKAAAASRVALAARLSAAAPPYTAGRQAASAPAPPPQQQQQPVGLRKQQPGATRKPPVKGDVSAKAAPASAGAAAAIPSRLAGRLGPASAVQDKEPSGRKPEVRALRPAVGVGTDTNRMLPCTRPCSSLYHLHHHPLQSSKRPLEQSQDVDDAGSARGPRRRAAGAVGFAISALQDALGPTSHVEAGSKVGVCCLFIGCRGCASPVIGSNSQPCAPTCRLLPSASVVWARLVPTSLVEKRLTCGQSLLRPSGQPAAVRA